MKNQISRRHARLAVEALEDRLVPATISISDATAIEGIAAYHFTDNFVAPDGNGLAASRDIRVGPDGNVYVASHDTDVVKVFESGTGRFLRDLSTPGGELDGPWGMTFGPDNRLYVAGRYSHNIISFDVNSGAYSVFVGANSGGLGLARGLVFGPDGNLYASSDQEPNFSTDTVKRFNGITGAYIDDFVTAGSGGLNNAWGVGFGPDGNLYVASNSSNEVKRYDGHTGAFIDNFVSVTSDGSGPLSILFHTDGRLYVGVGTTAARTINRYDANTGAFEDKLTSSPVGTNLSGPDGMAFGPSGELYVSEGTATLKSGSYVARFAPASFAAFTVNLNSPSSSTVSVNFNTADGTAIAGSDYISTAGTLTFVPGQTTQTFFVRTVNDTVAESIETFVVSLSNPVGATISDGTGVATITDDDATKFFVVNDGSPDQTYRYGAPGNSIGYSSLNSGNTAPRGAVSITAGTTVWVIDANKTVYIYNNIGTLLGSWTAGSLASNAQVEGIATNGTDIWLVDAKQGKVFRYAAAASRLSGSQNAASSFALNSNNTSPKDVVTDGTSLWVVNDSTTDKVFKYNMSGSLLGSWTIDSANAHPTGLTLDPSNPQHLWVVDNGTDRVYQYDNAVSRTSGSQSASTTFALAAGNTNPQGIADPPLAKESTTIALMQAQQAIAPVALDIRNPRIPGLLAVGYLSESVSRDKNTHSLAQLSPESKLTDATFASFSPYPKNRGWDADSFLRDVTVHEQNTKDMLMANKGNNQLLIRQSGMKGKATDFATHESHQIEGGDMLIYGL